MSADAAAGGSSLLAAAAGTVPVQTHSIHAQLKSETSILAHMTTLIKQLPLLRVYFRQPILLSSIVYVEDNNTSFSIFFLIHSLVLHILVDIG